jgi:hypothetical protein
MLPDPKITDPTHTTLDQHRQPPTYGDVQTNSLDIPGSTAMLYLTPCSTFDHFIVRGTARGFGLGFAYSCLLNLLLTNGNAVAFLLLSFSLGWVHGCFLAFFI